MKKKDARGMPYIRYLDGLRCISVCWVLLYHLRLHLKWQNGGALGLIASRGWMGVDMFFVISGFLITSILLNEHGQTGQISLPRFYARRILRIWPAYYLLIGLTLGFALLQIAMGNATASTTVVLETIKWPAAYLTNVYQSQDPTGPSSVLLHSWSLSLEEQFYLFWPLLLVLSIRIAKWIAATGILAVALWRTWLTFHVAFGAVAIRRIYFGPDTRIDVILYGVLLAFILTDERSAALVRKLLARWWVPFALLAAFAVAVRIDNRWSGHIGNSIGYSASALTMALIVAYLHTVKPTGILRILRAKPLVWIGRISYGMYLFQPLVIKGLGSVFGSPSGLAGIVLISVAAYGGTILVAGISYTFFESRFLRLKSRFQAIPQQPAVQVEAASG